MNHCINKGLIRNRVRIACHLPSPEDYRRLVSNGGLSIFSYFNGRKFWTSQESLGGDFSFLTPHFDGTDGLIHANGASRYTCSPKYHGDEYNGGTLLSVCCICEL
ncbi:MAG: hypothetical protein HQK53_17490 [Oligoflexia bacterium]|nr:hypothetical protein [Oligoflexia bacterium]